MDWGTTNRHGYLATSIPLRIRFVWGAASGVGVATIALWFGWVDWREAIVTAGGWSVVYMILAAAADLAAWRPASGIAVAALAGAGAGAVWWAMCQAPVDIWVVLATGSLGGLCTIWSYQDALQGAAPSNPPLQPTSGAEAPDRSGPL